MSFWQRRHRLSNRRVLTVTYYVEPRDLRMITVPVRRVNAFLAALALVCVWSLASLMYFGMQIANGSLFKDGMATAAASVPGLEVGSAEAVATSPDAIGAESAKAPVPEGAPDAESSEPYDYDRKLAADVEQVKADDFAKNMFTDLNMLAATKEKAAEKAVPADSAVSPGDKAKDAGKQSVTRTGPGRLAFEDVQLKFGKESLALRFKIRNHGDEKAKGAVWGVATYVDESGTTHLVGSHKGLLVERPADPANQEVATSYGARRVTRKALKFAVPGEGKGVFTDLRIYALDTVAKELVEDSVDLP